MKIFDWFKRKKSSGIFIPYDGNFIEFKEKPEDDSINGIGLCLGYHPDQVHIYFGDFNALYGIRHIVMEIFTKNIVFVQCDENVAKVKKHHVNAFLKKYTIEEEFDSYSANYTFSCGIKNKSLTFDYLGKVLGLVDIQPEGIVLVQALSINLFFINGLLVDFQSADGLNVSAKKIRKINPELFNSYEAVARKYWGNSLPDIINELNFQMDGILNIPDALNNENVSYHMSADGTINFAMLFVCHYSKTITLQDFIKINYMRFVKLNEFEYHLGRFKYVFSSDGILMSASLIS